MRTAAQDKMMLMLARMISLVDQDEDFVAYFDNVLNGYEQLDDLRIKGYFGSQNQCDPRED